MQQLKKIIGLGFVKRFYHGKSVSPKSRKVGI